MGGAKTAAAQAKDDTVFCYVRVTGYCMNIFDEYIVMILIPEASFELEFFTLVVPNSHLEGNGTQRQE